MSEKIKIDELLSTSGDTPVRAITAYDRERKIMSSGERGEKPSIRVNLELNKKRGREVKLIFIGRHHSETPNHWKKDPQDWSTFGYSVLSLQEAAQLVKNLNAIVKSASKLHVSDEVLRLEAQLVDLGVDPREVIREESARKRPLKVWKGEGKPPRPKPYQFNEKETAEIYRAKIKELKQLQGSRNISK